ncbi:MAG: YciI family protein [Gemmatimonadales bacterium]
MRYLCLIYSNESEWEAMSPAEIGAYMGEYNAFTKSVQESGHYIGGNPLQPTSTATTVRLRNGKVSMTDGPFAETKEQLGGYYLINARDLNEAVQIASRIPSARIGSIEVRPIQEIGPS